MTDSQEVSELEHIRWLIQSADAELTEKLPDDPLKLATHFRKRHGRERSRLLCELRELRKRARSKFTAAGDMFFTRRGFEQSTSELIAAHKAQRFPASASIVDLCCGIGGDAIALSRQATELTIVDSSSSVIELAKRNLQIHNANNVTAQICDVRKLDLTPFDAWHIDPDRRVDDRRRSAPEQCEPPLDEFLDSIRSTGASMNGCIKLSPAANVEHLLENGAELEWIGSNRECQQQVAWLGDLAKHPGKRTATWLSVRDGSACEETLVENRDAPNILTDWLGNPPKFIYEPRPSVLAAGLDSSLAAQFELHSLPTSVAWLASNAPAESNLFTRLEFLKALPFNRKSIARLISEAGYRINEVKTRGVNVEPTQLLRELSSAGDDRLEHAMLVLIQLDRSLHAVVARR